MISKRELATATLCNVVGLGLAAGWESLKSLQPPRGVQTLVNKNRDPQVGEVVEAHNIAIFLDSAVLGVGRRMPIGTTSVCMSFTDKEGRAMTAVLDTVDRPAQPLPKLKDFDIYLDGDVFEIISIDRDGRLKVTKQGPNRQNRSMQ